MKFCNKENQCLNRVVASPIEYERLHRKYERKLQYNFPSDLFSDKKQQESHKDKEEEEEVSEGELSISIEYIEQ